MILLWLIQSLIVVGTSWALAAEYNWDISRDASVLFQNAAVNGRGPRCQLLRREPRNRPAFFTQVLTKPENTTARFSQVANVLNHDIDSLAAMISLLVDEHSLPASRSYVNVLLTNHANIPNMPIQQFLLSQSFKATSPYLKVTGGAADALSVKTLQLNMLLPMTGVNYSLASDLANMKTSQWETALLPAGKYAVEVQIVRADSKGKGGSNLRVGGWQKLPSVGAGTALDQVTLRRGDEVTGCVRLEQTFSVPWIEVDHRVSDTMPLVLNAGGQEADWFGGRSGNASYPFMAAQPVFVVATGLPFEAAQSSGVPRVRYDNISLEVINILGGDLESCNVREGRVMTVPFIITASHVATFSLPTIASGCGLVLFRAAYVYPDHLHRLSTDIYSMAASEEAGCSACLAAAMNAEVDVTGRLIVGLTTVLGASSSLVPLEPAFSAADFVRDAVQGVTNTSSLQSFRALWDGRLDAWNVTQIFAATLAEAETVLTRVTPYTSVDQSNSSDYIFNSVYAETDDYFEGTDDYFSQNISTRRLSSVAAPQVSPMSSKRGATSLQKDLTAIELASEESCAMGVFVNALNAVNTALVKLFRSTVTVRASIVQIQGLQNQDPASSFATVLRNLTAANATAVPDALVEPLVRLYAQVMLVEVLTKNVQRLTNRLAFMQASGCTVPCLQSPPVTVSTVTSCDTFIDVPLTYPLEPFTTHAQSCAADWYPIEIQRINAVLDGTSMPVMDMSEWLPSDVYAWSDWSSTMDKLTTMRMPAARASATLRDDMVSVVTTPLVWDPNTCIRMEKDGGRTTAISCRCYSFAMEDNLEPLTINVQYLASWQAYRPGNLVVQVPMTRTPIVPRAAWGFLSLQNVTASSEITGEYYRWPVPGFEDAFVRNDQQYLLLLRRGRASCPKGEWGVVPASSAWKKYADPALPWNNATDTLIAQFRGCFFHSMAEKQAFTVAQSYNLTALEVFSGYNLQFV